MKNNPLTEFILAGLLIALLIVILNPLHIWMPSMLHMIMLASALVVFSVLAVFVVRERSADEREQIHKLHAGRIGFLVGATALIVGIVYQSYFAMLDDWLIVALVLMIVAKFAAHFWDDRNL